MTKPPAKTPAPAYVICARQKKKLCRLSSGDRRPPAAEKRSFELLLGDTSCRKPLGNTMMSALRLSPESGALRGAARQPRSPPGTKKKQKQRFYIGYNTRPKLAQKISAPTKRRTTAGARRGQEKSVLRPARPGGGGAARYTLAGHGPRAETGGSRAAG